MVDRMVLIQQLCLPLHSDGSWYMNVIPTPSADNIETNYTFTSQWPID